MSWGGKECKKSSLAQVSKKNQKKQTITFVCGILKRILITLYYVENSKAGG